MSLSQFGCNIKDLEPSQEIEPQVENKSTESEEILTHDQKKPILNEEPVSNRHISRVKNNTISTETKQFPDVKTNPTVIEAIVKDLQDPKNHRVYLIVIGLYVILNSQSMYKIINDMFPYLMESITKPNVGGQIVISIIIATAVIISRYSFLKLF